MSTPADSTTAAAAPSPADLVDARRPRPVFDGSGASGAVARERAAARGDAHRRVSQLSAVLSRLLSTTDALVDLDVEAYRRTSRAAIAAVERLDRALAAPGGPPVPPPGRRP